MHSWKFLFAVFFGILTSCQRTQNASNADVASKHEIKIGASAVPHTAILRKAAELLTAKGIALKITTFSDYVQPNLRLAEGDLDANYYQTVPYLDFFNAQHHLHLVSLGPVHIEPFGLYSKKHKNLDALPQGALIAIPNEISNGHRALELLAEHHLIELDPKPGLAAGVKHILANPRNLRFKEVESAMMPRILDDVDVAGINTNYALGAGLNPSKDALALESAKSPYANILVVRQDHIDNPDIKQLVEILHSDALKTFIETTYHGNVLAAP